MWRLFRRERPAIVHTHSSKGGILGRWAAWAAGVPVIYHTAHGFGFHDYQHRAVRNFYIWLERLTAKISTRIVVVSYANADRGEKARVFKRHQWILCRDAIPVADFTAEQPRRTRLKEWGIADGKVVVGMVACFKPQKAPLDFVDLAACVLGRTDRAHFVMAGDGELRPAVEDRIRRHGIGRHITLLGWQRNMPEVYRNLDIAVLTSLWEGLPCVFSEAMASGLPVVATDVDGAKEAIAHGENGFLHPPHDIAGLAGSVSALISDASLRRSMGERGKSRAGEFDIGASVARLETAYEECLKSLSCDTASLSF
jgi:glycosyltransferase involved in cell wall biosynthesis